MFLTHLEIQHVRNLASEKLECDPGINLILGANAAGKTAVLEAIHLLSAARSFRTPRAREVIQYGRESLLVTANLIDQHRNTISAGIEKGKSQTQIRFKGQKVGRRSEQIQNIPVISIVPETLNLLSAAPKTRRHWLDWALFHVEPRYFSHWHAYHQALRQRNALLRQGKLEIDALEIWEGVMVENAGRLRQPRREYLKVLRERLQEIAGNMFRGIELQLKTPDENDERLQEDLRMHRHADARMGHTQSGPHRMDVGIVCNGRPAAQTLSRGEGKRLLILLMLAQAAEYRAIKKQAPILLVDDLAAELDSDAMKSVLELLYGQEMQAFITAISADPIVGFIPEYSVFHVEHGCLQKMVN